MTGDDLTDKQIENAENFIRGRISKNSVDVPGDDFQVSIPFSDLVKLVAWYGAIRYEGALSGVGEDGSAVVVRRKAATETIFN